MGHISCIGGMWVALGLVCGLCFASQAIAKSKGAKSFFDVTDYGAKGDGAAMDTQAIQKAIDACAESGGGTVFFPQGTYLCGSLHLKSHITLMLDTAATIKGSLDTKDYDPVEKLDFKSDSDHETSFFHHALIWGEDIEDIGIVGRGTIDGNRNKRGGPKPIALKRCKDVTIRDITIMNSPNYCISMLGTDYVNIDGVTIRKAYCDGIDPDCCRHVRISNCVIESHDDAIVLKASFSLGEARSTEYITVTNCQLATECNAFKLGTESRGDFKHIAVSNCVFYLRPGFDAATSGISLESVDGSNIDGVVISNIDMVDVEAPIFIRLGNRGRDMPTPVPGTLRNVVISNITASGQRLTSSITGIPDHAIEGVTLSDIRLVYTGAGADFKPLEEVPERIPDYPDADMFEGLPAYGLYCRHVDGLKLRNVQLLYEGDESRPALVCDDVRELELDSLTTMTSHADSLIRFINVQNALVRGCTAPKEAPLFLDALGPETRGVSVMSNDLGRAKRGLRVAAEVGKGQVVDVGNR